MIPTPIRGGSGDEGGVIDRLGDTHYHGGEGRIKPNKILLRRDVSFIDTGNVILAH